ncbi:hypothetical protein [Lentzea sp. E54]|uniref:hypothetical protein n=1 Tax=Lentzea xerophila TaxID=3435883 RepID=UPI003DA31312
MLPPPGFSRIRATMSGESSMPSTATPASLRGNAIRPVPIANSSAVPPNPARNRTVSASSPRGELS